jgi:hypothetical protein
MEMMAMMENVDWGWSVCAGAGVGVGVVFCGMAWTIRDVHA